MFTAMGFHSSFPRESKASSGEFPKDVSKPVEKDYTVVSQKKSGQSTLSKVEMTRRLVESMPSYVPGVDELEGVANAAWDKEEALDPSTSDYLYYYDARARVGELAKLQESMPPDEFAALLKKESRDIFETMVHHVPRDSDKDEYVINRRHEASSSTLPVAWKAPGPPLTLKDGSQLGSRKASGLDAGAVATFLRGLGTESSPNGSFASRFPEAGASDDSRRELGYQLAAHTGTGRRELVLAENDRREVVGFADLVPVDVDELGQHFTAQDKTGFVRNVRTCELSVITGDAHQGKGLGKALLAQAIQTARADGFEQVTAVVHKDNEGMLKLLDRAGIKDHVPARTDGYLHFVADLAKLG